MQLSNRLVATKRLLSCNSINALLLSRLKPIVKTPIAKDLRQGGSSLGGHLIRQVGQVGQVRGLPWV